MIVDIYFENYEMIKPFEMNFNDLNRDLEYCSVYLSKCRFISEKIFYKINLKQQCEATFTLKTNVPFGILKLKSKS